ncbi:MAG TPA: hypothetical protein EYP88_08850 [Anaerolineales bacterium]|nr:hypothetical protein [Anaerolineales bacterium]
MTAARSAMAQAGRTYCPIKASSGRASPLPPTCHPSSQRSAPRSSAPKHPTAAPHPLRHTKPHWISTSPDNRANPKASAGR